jgi:tetratricopeptide (TPR) repeat protein
VESTARENQLVAGRYRVRRELARGGVGAVYEALDESTGKRVALKRLLHDPAEKPRLAMLFEAEYDTLSRLRHPRIVEVYDYGIDRRGPYFTMELLDGQDIGELEPIPYVDACRYLRDVASSLALLHTRRRLHRDLSPRNVRLTSDGHCRLLDFGTMASFGVAEDIVGTPPLVPPEALRGTALDHRADLYSLGALAYRLLSGRYPYRARQLEDLPELWRTAPARLREVAPEAPIELDELIMSMLNLDPTYRPNTTYEVIDRLTAIGGLPPAEDSGLTAQGYLVGTRLIGRTRQLESIQRHIARAHREQGGTVVIEGNPGVGKSRLLDEAALQAQLSGALTVRVAARTQHGEYAVANALVKAIFEAAPQDARDAAAPYAASLRHVYAAFTRIPGSQSGAPSQAQLNAALLSWLFDLSEDRTLVLVVDDLPRVDESSAVLLSALAHQLPRHRILLIVARRLADKIAAPAGAEAIVAHGRRLRLHRLRREHTLALIQSLFGAVPNVELLANWIHEVTTGSPTQIMELARHIVDENIVRFVDGLWVLPPSIPDDDLPRSLAATLSARVAALPKAERALAEVLCVRRGTLPLQLCLKLFDHKDPRVLFRNLDELVAKGVLVSGTNGYHFEQDALREVLLAELPPKRMRRLRRRLGEALLQLGAARPEDTIEAGFNLLQGGAEMRGADLLAGAAAALPRRGAITTAALPALEAALELYEKWGRPPHECLRLRTVLVASMDHRMVAQYGDETLEALCACVGAELAATLRPWMGARAALLCGRASAYARGFFAPHLRGLDPRSALENFYHVAFGVLSVRTSVLDVRGTERLVNQTESLAAASGAGPLVAHTFRALLLALRGDVSAARQAGQSVLAELNVPGYSLAAGEPAFQGGILTGVYIGLGMIEAQYALHSRQSATIIDELRRLIGEAGVVEPFNAPTSHTGAISAAELGLVIGQLRVAHHLGRGERNLAEARRDELLGGSVQTGMQHQFEIWRNLIETNMSLRTSDVAGLRRCVEIFTHYVADHAELVAVLEIARAHLALCLGKPQEAVRGYEKWLDHIRPGEMMSWEALCSGYADALLALGQAQRARDWLEALLRHPVVRAAPDSTCRVTFEATLALAESDCQQLERASARIAKVRADLADSDHPLALGFAHEASARIAHRLGDETACREHGLAMTRWYGSTRNAALLMRGRRVLEALHDPKIPAPPAAGNESDRAIPTRVTARREAVAFEALGGPSAEQRQRCDEALRLVIQSAGGREGFLYLPGSDGLQLAAAAGAEPAQELERVVQSALERQQANGAVVPGSTTAPLELASVERCEARYALFVLVDPTQHSPAGAVLVGSGPQPISGIATELLRSIAVSLMRPLPDSTP